MQQKASAVQRRGYMANSGPSVFGIKRMDRLMSPSGEIFLFLGARDGDAILERENKTKGEPFVTVDSSEISRWSKQQ